MSVTAKFDQQAKTYDKATPIQSDVAFFLAKQIWAVDYQAEGQIWLDVGCGTGKLSQAVLTEFLNNLQRLPTTALPFSQLIGVDNSPAMLTIWQKNCQKTSQAVTLQPLLADMIALPLANNSVDGVISSFALHWATPQVIAELGRVVKKGGYLWLAIPVKGSFSHVTSRFPELPIYPFLPSDDWKNAIDELVKKRQGEILFLQQRSFSHPYPNLSILLKDLKHMGGAVSGQSPINLSVLRQYLSDTAPIDLDYQLLLVGLTVN